MKLEALQENLRTLITIKHPNISAIHAVKLTMSHPPKIVILMDRQGGMYLRDLLPITSSVNVEKATVSLNVYLNANEIYPYATGNLATMFIGLECFT